MAIAYIHLQDLDAALHYLAAMLERREEKLGRLHSEVLNVLFLSGYSFLLKANRFNIVQDGRRMDKKKQENAVEVNYHLSLCAFKDRIRRLEVISLTLT